MRLVSNSKKRTRWPLTVWDNILSHINDCRHATTQDIYSSTNLHSPATDQVPIHTVTLDVQDHDKTQQLPADLPKDFQEVGIVFPCWVIRLQIREPVAIKVAAACRLTSC